MTENLFTIGALAKQTNVSVETIRYYQRRGLLTEPEKPLGSVRRYSKSHIQRIRFIKHGQKLGFSLNEIKELLTLEDGCHCAEAQEIAKKKLSLIQEHIESLYNMEKALINLLSFCADNKDLVTCPIISTLQKCEY